MTGEDFAELPEDFGADTEEGADSREEPRTYEELIAIGTSMRKVSDSNDWELGDLCVEVVDLSERAKQRLKWARDNREAPEESDRIWQDERNALHRFASDIGWETEHLVARKRAAARIPKSHWIRRSKLSFSHIRALAPIKDDAKLEETATYAIEQNLSVHQLFKLIKEADDTEKVEEGKYLCAECRETITDVGAMVKLEAGRLTVITCGWAHAANYAYRQADCNPGNSILEDLESLEEDLEEASA